MHHHTTRRENNHMRNEKGKLICIWSPVLHGEGGSTLACLIGFGMQYYSGGRVLIVNKGNTVSHMEKYVEKDMDIRYSMDNLKIFNTGIKAEHILTYATKMNTGLYMIAGSRISKDITGENSDFDRLFIDKCLEGFDIVIVDIDTGVRKENRLYLDKADKIIAVLTPNEIVIDELYQNQGVKDVLDYFTDNKTVRIINKLYDGWEPGRVLGRYKSRYSLSNVFGLDYDGDILNACCTERNLYSYTMKNIMHEKNKCAKQLNGICSFLISELNIENKVCDVKHGGVFRRLVRSSLY